LALADATLTQGTPLAVGGSPVGLMTERNDSESSSTDLMLTLILLDDFLDLFRGKTNLLLSAFLTQSGSVHGPIMEWLFDTEKRAARLASDDHHRSHRGFRGGRTLKI
jgi:hypothetical protein